MIETTVTRRSLVAATSIATVPLLLGTSAAFAEDTATSNGTYLSV